MSDLINRKDVVAVLCFCEETKMMLCKDLRKILEKINDIPSAEPERKKGKWEYPRKFGHAHLLGKCSVCGKYESAEWIVLDNPNYCPHCGADMRGDDES